MKRKRILVTTEKLIEKIDNYNNNACIIYFDIMNKKILEDEEFMSFVADNDNCYELGDNIFFVRDAPINVYKALLDAVRKYNDGEHLINILLPMCLIDFDNNIEYYTDDKINDELIKNIKL